MVESSIRPTGSFEALEAEPLDPKQVKKKKVKQLKAVGEVSSVVTADNTVLEDFSSSSEPSNSTRCSQGCNDHPHTNLERSNSTRRSQWCNDYPQTDLAAVRTKMFSCLLR